MCAHMYYRQIIYDNLRYILPFVCWKERLQERLYSIQIKDQQFNPRNTEGKQTQQSKQTNGSKGAI